MRGIVIPLGLLFLAGLFTPLNPLQKNSVINPSLGGLQSNATLVCTVNGCTSYPFLAATPQGLCDVNNGLTSSYVKQIQSVPLLGNIFNFFASVGSFVNYFFTGNTNALQSSANCYKASETIISLQFNTKAPDTVTYGIIGAVFTVLGVIVLLGITVVGSGLNTGSIFIGMIGGTLLIIWVILSSAAVPTFRQLPNPVGPYLYFILTLWYAISVIGNIGGLKE